MEEKAIRGIPWTFLTLAGSRLVQIAGDRRARAAARARRTSASSRSRSRSPSSSGLVASLGLGGVFVVEQDLSEREKGTYLTMFLLMGAAFAVVMAALSPLAARFFDEPRLDEIVLALSVMVFFSGGLNWFYEALMQRELEFRSRFVAQMVQAFTYSGIGIAPGGARGRGVEPRRRPDRGRGRLRRRTPVAGAVPRPPGVRQGRGRARGARGPGLPRPDGDELRGPERRHRRRRPGARCGAVSATTPWRCGSPSFRTG